MTISATTAPVTTVDYSRRVKAIAAATFNVDEADIADDLQYRGIDEWDSVGHMDLLLKLESAFGFKLDAGLLTRLNSISAIVKYLEYERNGDPRG